MAESLGSMLRVTLCCLKNIMDDETRYKIVDEIFDQIDIDDSGTIVM